MTWSTPPSEVGIAPSAPSEGGGGGEWRRHGGARLEPGPVAARAHAGHAAGHRPPHPPPRRYARRHLAAPDRPGPHPPPLRRPPPRPRPRRPRPLPPLLPRGPQRGQRGRRHRGRAESHRCRRPHPHRPLRRNSARPPGRRLRPAPVARDSRSPPRLGRGPAIALKRLEFAPPEPDRRRSQMESPIEVVHRFCAAWGDGTAANDPAAFFTDDALY